MEAVDSKWQVQVQAPKECYLIVMIQVHRNEAVGLGQRWYNIHLPGLCPLLEASHCELAG